MINVFEPYIFSSDKINVLKSLNKKELSGTSGIIGKFENELADFCIENIQLQFLTVLLH